MYSLGHHSLAKKGYRVIRRHAAGLVALIILVVYLPWGFRHVQSSERRPVSNAVVTEVNGNGRFVALMIDESAPLSLTPEVLEVLDRSHAKATFFLTSVLKSSLKRPIEEILHAGDGLGNHTEGHINLASHSLAEDVLDLTRENQTLQFFGAPRPYWLLPPYGAINKTVVKAAEMTGLQLVMPSDASPDTLSESRSEIIQQVMSHVGPGAIILFHISSAHPDSLDALPVIVQLLMVEGYHIGSLNEVDNDRKR